MGWERVGKGWEGVRAEVGGQEAGGTVSGERRAGKRNGGPTMAPGGVSEQHSKVLLSAEVKSELSPPPDPDCLTEPERHWAQSPAWPWRALGIRSTDTPTDLLTAPVRTPLYDELDPGCPIPGADCVF